MSECPLLKQKPTLALEAERQHLTRRLWVEGELEFSVFEDTVTGTLFLRIQVGEPADPSTRVALKLRALGFQKVKVTLLLLHVGDSIGRGRASRARLHRGPTVFSQDDLLAINLGVDPLQVILYETPGSTSSGGLCTEERQHVERDEVNGIQNGLSAAVGLVTVSHIGDSDEDTEGSEVRLCRLDLGSEGVGVQDVIEQGLRAELDRPSDKLGLGVIVEGREEAVSAGLPHAAAIKAELGGVKGQCNVRQRINGPMDT